MEFNEKILSICLPSQAAPSADFMNRYTVTVQGWGADNDGNIGADLTLVDLTIRKKSICDKKYENLSPARLNYYFPNMTISSMFCADGNLRRDAGTCHGDSGGPAIIK